MKLKEIIFPTLFLFSVILNVIQITSMDDIVERYEDILTNRVYHEQALMSLNSDLMSRLELENMRRATLIMQLRRQLGVPQPDSVWCEVYQSFTTGEWGCNERMEGNADSLTLVRVLNADMF
jgi:hypothetical protein